MNATTSNVTSVVTIVTSNKDTIQTDIKHQDQLHQENTVLLEKTQKATPKIVLSRSEDDDVPLRLVTEMDDKFPSLYYYSPRRGCISAEGATKMHRFRNKLHHRSHTCGSLFVNCDCTSSNLNQELYFSQPNAKFRTPSATSRPLFAANKTTSIPQSETHSQISSIKSRFSSSGFHSLSSQGSSSIASTFLSQDESQVVFNKDGNMPSLLTPFEPSRAHSRETLIPFEKQDSTSSTKSAPIESIQGTDDVIARIGSISLANKSSSSQSCNKSPKQISKWSRKSESSLQTNQKKLFQSYSHPDTTFVFTDIHKHPKRRSLANQQTTPNKEFSKSTRNSLDSRVNVEPFDDRERIRSLIHDTGSSAQQQQRRGLLERKPKVELCDISPDLHSEQVFQSDQNVGDSTQQDTSESSFVNVQKYILESGFFGSINVTNKFLRKTSKAFLENNIMDQIRNSLNNNNQSNNDNGQDHVKSKETQLSTSKTKNEPEQTFLNVESSINVEIKDNEKDNISDEDTVRLKRRISMPTVAKCSFSPNITTPNTLIMDDKDALIKSLQGEIFSLQDVIKSRDNEIFKLRREIHKLKDQKLTSTIKKDKEQEQKTKSVLEQTTGHLNILNDDLLQSANSSTILTNNQKNNENNSINNLNISNINNNLTDDNYYQSKFCKSCLLHYNSNILPIFKQFQSTEIKSNSVKQLFLLENNNIDKSTNIKNIPSGQHFVQNGKLNNVDPILNISTRLLKKQGVSGECSDSSHLQSTINNLIPKYEKDIESKRLIKEAILDNDFLQNIDLSQIKEIADSMYPLIINEGKYLIREGEVGSHLYVSAHGTFEVSKNGKILGFMEPGKAFGELAILYNCTRTASVRVLNGNARVWVLDRRVFQQIMMQSGIQRLEENLRFLKSVPLLKDLNETTLQKMAGVLEMEFYSTGTYIIRQGDSGNTFFIICQGTVRVTQRVSKTSVEEREIRLLGRGDYFGEQALINEDKRTANIIALSPGVECLALDRESFTQLIGDLSELKEKCYEDENENKNENENGPNTSTIEDNFYQTLTFDKNLLKQVNMMKKEEELITIIENHEQQEFVNLTLNDLNVVTTLGIGGFGRVNLVRVDSGGKTKVFALKCLKKIHIVETKQEKHVLSERNILLNCKCPFICRLFRTFRDDKYVYLMLEPCMGGEIWTILRDYGPFTDTAAKFITACVLEAFSYLHERNIVYRDLKPENLMLNEHGYVKLVDFGFAKCLKNGSKTWTFCGTPEYVAPEVILNKGHDRSVDYWGLGILIHELLNGTPPFNADDALETYNLILKGINMIDFPRLMSRFAVHLIKKLCREVPSERLGYQRGGVQDIKNHKWFRGLDWKSLQRQTLVAPFSRTITHPLDTSYFDKFSPDYEETPIEMSGWDSEF